MATSASSPTEEYDARFKTPAPELDDHRPIRLPRSPQFPRIPVLEVQQPTPKASIQDPLDLMRIDEALQAGKDSTHVARDFENAVESDISDNEADPTPGNGRRSSTKPRRFTNRVVVGDRVGRPREGRPDKSRESSSSRSTSPANSVEAFAEPRRRQRANTIESRRSSIADFVQRATTFSQATHSRRGTFSHVSAPPGMSRGTVQDTEERYMLPDDEDTGKTYKIDFEELDEFVALYAQGKISDEYPRSYAADSNVGDVKKVFGDLRRKVGHDGIPNACLNGDTFCEKPVCEGSTAESSNDEKVAEKVVFPQIPEERFTFFSSEIQSGITATKLGDFVGNGMSFRDLFDIDGTWWLDVLNPTRAELEVLAKAFKIHRLTKEDIQTQEAREKVELFSQYYFVCFRSFNMNKRSDDFLDPIHVYIVVTADGVLSFSFEVNPHAKNVRKRISKRGDFLSLGPDYICYAMIDDIVDSFAPIIREAETESEGIEDQVFVAREDDLSALLKQIGDCRKRVLNMMRLLGGKADVIKGFAKRCNEQYEITPRGDIGLYLGDIQDHVVTMMSNLGHVEKMLSRSHANYLAQLNVDSIIKGNSTNKALAKITVVATILVPLNFITGLFGMNVNVPGKEADGLGWFFGIIGVVIFCIIAGLFTARKLRAI